MSLTRGGRFQPAIRTLNYDFSNCVSSPVCSPFPSSLQVSSVAAANTFTSGIDLREMGVPSSLGDLRLLMSFNLDSIGGGDWRLVFNPGDPDCSGSSLVTIRRTGADTWEIEASPSHVACLKRQEGGGEFTFSGLYEMPFKITMQTN